jgi:hypothetical protein
LQENWEKVRTFSQFLCHQSVEKHENFYGKNGEVITKEKVTGGETQLLYTDKITPDQSSWYRLDVYDSDGAMSAITNPIFIGPRKFPQIQTYGEVLNLTFPEHDPAG